MAQTFITPTALAPIAGPDGKPSPEWHQHWTGIEELSKRVAVNIAPLGPSPTNAEIATAFNNLLTALQAANLQNTV